MSALEIYKMRKDFLHCLWSRNHRKHGNNNNGNDADERDRSRRKDALVEGRHGFASFESVESREQDE